MLTAGTGCWVKIFEDNSFERGTDADINRGRASWSRGKLADIKTVILSDGAMDVFLDAPNQKDWHQFDRFIVPVSVGMQAPIRTHRVIQIKILPDYVKSFLHAEGFAHRYCFFISNKNGYSNSVTNYFSLEIDKSLVGQWFTVVLPKGKKPYYLISDAKGRLNGDFQQILK